MYPQLYPRERKGSQLHDTGKSAISRFQLPDIQQIVDSIDGVRSTVLTIDLAFTGGAGNTQLQPNTRELPYALLILGAQTNLQNITVKFYDNEGKEMMPAEVPIQTVAALKDDENPWFPWPWVHCIPPQGHIKVQCTDVNGEGAGSISFDCLAIPQDAYDAGKIDAILRLKPWWEQVALTFNGVANQEIAPKSTRQEEPVIVTGFQTALQSAKIKPLFPDDQDLSPDYEPIGTYAQPATAFHHFQALRLARRLGKRAQVTLNIKNAGTEANSNIYVIGIKDQR